MTENTTPTKKSDWLWNALTVACLVVSGTFVTNTLHAFSRDGFDLLQTFGAISQGAGLLLITGGTLTDKGREIIQNILATFKVSPDRQAEGTFAIAFMILAFTGLINFSLPLLGEYYYQRGQGEYEEGKLAAARFSFEQATHFVREETEINDSIHVALGNIYETMGDQISAEPHYQEAAAAGNPAALNGLGRVQLRTAWAYQDLLLAETSFRVGLAQEDLDPALKAEMLSHLGIVLIKQAETKADRAAALQKEAEAVLQQGVKLDKTLTERTPGLGLSHCYLAILNKKLNRPHQWEDCTKHALPTSFDQFREIIFYADPGIGAQINTSGIVKAEG
ncbi:MAG: hypothetical protein ACPGSM_13890 [Thiolinea sp.]